MGLVAGVLLGGAVAVGGVAPVNAADPVTVRRVIDGDTVDVVVDGDVRRVRLLNVDAPETVHPDETVQCLGPEAAALLRELLPVGTEVTLKYDAERKDRYGRDLAGVVVGDTLVNVELARAGLGVAVLHEPNDRFYDVVRAAQREAETDERGLFDTAVECTLPARVQAFQTKVEQALEQCPAAGSGLEALQQHRRVLGRTVIAGAPLNAFFNGRKSRLPEIVHTDYAVWRARFRDSRDTLLDARKATTGDIAAERARVAEDARLAEEARLEGERLAAERAARDAEAARSSSSSSTNSGGSGSSGTGSSGGYDGYTGCRAYGGGYAPNAIDEKGRPYTKISCTTKLPIP